MRYIKVMLYLLLLVVLFPIMFIWAVVISVRERTIDTTMFMGLLNDIANKIRET